MLIVDSQIHIWSSNLPTNPAHRQITSYTAEDVLRDMDEAGVDAAVIHPPGWDPGSDALSVEAARSYPNRFSILGKFALDDPASGDLIPTWKGPARYVGAALHVFAASSAVLADRRHDGLALARGRGGGAPGGTCLRQLPSSGGGGGRAVSAAEADR